MDWHVVIIHTKQEAVELIADSLYDLGVKGIEIVDLHLSQQERDRLIVDYIDESIVPSEDIQIKCYFSVDEEIEKKIDAIQHALDHLTTFMDIGFGTIELEVTKEEDWANNWKQYYKPFRIGKNIVVKPVWEVFEDIKPHDLVIDIDPGMAFGCGTHETTAMCVLLLQKYLKANEHLVDVGCGSGILSIIAGKLGAGKIEAVDIDETAVRVARENVNLNQMNDLIQIYNGDLIACIEEQADLVVANIMADIIIILTEDIKRILKPGGFFISSGIIEEKKAAVVEKIISVGFEIVEIMQEKDWVAITAKLKE